ncbi:MAG TPA: cytochrome d ubiquinol oxidase subunit II [Solirubrobacterales bacterium]|nr:cytochrome d ubiquinol oxidase subunit II [Solirubrobacterales bacterium]
MDAYTFLQALWFVLISVLWLGYFVLEGFDFGVGMLIRAVGKTKEERRAVIHSIGPVWDGNEVWLLVAGGATFAAFPQWYATLFSGFYLALFLILVGLIVRNVSFEFWGKAASERGRERWEWALIFGSFLPALLWGVGWANIVHGVPIDAGHEYTGTLFTLLNPYALLGGLTTLAIFLAHGAIFLSLRTTDAVAERARGIGATVAPVAAALGVAFLVWTVASHPGGIDVGSTILAAVAALALVAAAALADVSPGRAFAATTVGILIFFLALFVDLFPHTMVSSTSSAFDMTLSQSASSDYTLTVMTVVAVLLVPVVLAYQAWTYWVFRQRVSADGFGGGDGDGHSPLDLVKQAKADIERARGEDDTEGTPGEPAGAAGP